MLRDDSPSEPIGAVEDDQLRLVFSGTRRFRWIRRE